MGQRAVTLAEVAASVGLSRSTASLVFRGSPAIPEPTRSLVMDAAERLGYVYNRRAAALRLRRTNTLGLITPGQANPFFGGLTAEIERLSRLDGYTLLLGNTLESPEREVELIRTFMELRIDGLLVVPVIGSTPSALRPLAALGIPTVVLTRRMEPLTTAYVGSDDRLGGRRAAEHLVAHGCSRVAYFGGPSGVFTHVDRLAGVRGVLQERGAILDEDWSAHSETTSEAGYDLARRLLEHSAPPPGLICHSDAIALGAVRALQEAGYAIGEQVRVVGFDDVDHARFWTPALTTVRVDVTAMAGAALRALSAQLEPSAPTPEVAALPPRLMVRESCGCLPARTVTPRDGDRPRSPGARAAAG